MPFIHIRSLPFRTPLDVPQVLQALSQDFALATGTALEHVSATWQFLQPGYFAVAGRTAPSQPSDSHPLLVTVLAPDFWPPSRIEQSLQAVAYSLGEQVPSARNNVFIHHCCAHSGQVFDGGDIVRWPAPGESS